MNHKTVVALALIAVAVAGIATASVFARLASDAERQVSIARANLAALQDTVERYVDDSTRTSTLMALQADVNEDSIAALEGSLAEALRGRDQSLRSLQSLQLAFSRLQGEFASVRVTVAEDSMPIEEVAQFDLQGPPIDGSIWVTYQPTPPWRLRTDLGVTPFAQTYAVGCDEAMNAIVNVTTPDWVSATLERGVIAPDVCNPVRPQPVFAFSFGKVIWGVGGGIFGALIHAALSGGD